MGLKEKSIKGMMWSLTESFGIRVFSVATYFILAGILDPSTFGLVALSNTYLQFTSIFVEQGFTTALVQRKDIQNEHLSSAFWGSFIIGCICALISVLASPFIANFYNSPELENIIKVSSILFIIGSTNKTHQALLLRKFNFKALAKARIISIIVSGTLGIVLALKGFGVWSLVLQLIVYNTIETIIVWIESHWTPKFFFSWGYYKDVLKFGSKIMFNNFLNYTNRYIDDLLIGYFLGTSILGYYSLAYKIYATVTDLIVLSISKVALPLFSSLQNEKEKFQFTFIIANKITCYVAVAAFSIAGLLGPDIVVMALGEKWLPSTPIIQILSVGGMLLCVYWLTDQSLISLGKLKQSMLFNLTNGILCVVLLVSLVNFGVNAVALSYPIRALLVFPIIILIVKKHLHIKPAGFINALSKPYLTAMLSAAFVFTFSYFFQGNAIAGLVMKFSIIALFNLFAIYLFEPYIFKTIKSVLFDRILSVNR